MIVFAEASTVVAMAINGDGGAGARRQGRCGGRWGARGGCHAGILTFWQDPVIRVETDIYSNVRFLLFFFDYGQIRYRIYYVNL